MHVFIAPRSSYIRSIFFALPFYFIFSYLFSGRVGSIALLIDKYLTISKLF